MAGAYIDTSVLGRVLLIEPDAPAIIAELAGYSRWWSSELLVVELRRLATKEGLGPAGEALLAGMQLTPITTDAIQRASTIEPVVVRSLDAIHLDAAVQLHAAGDVAVVFTYDRQLQAGCAHHGLAVVVPT